jgi:hypothetical protein
VSTLSDAQIDRIRFELGYHILQAGAAPYITDRSLFAQVIQPNVEGEGYAIVVEILQRISDLKETMAPPSPGANGVSGATLASLLANSGGIKKIDELEFYPGQASSTTSYVTTGSAAGGPQFSTYKGQLNYWRDELAAALGVENLWAAGRGGSALMESY